MLQILCLILSGISFAIGLSALRTKSIVLKRAGVDQRGETVPEKVITGGNAIVAGIVCMILAAGLIGVAVYISVSLGR